MKLYQMLGVVAFLLLSSCSTGSEECAHDYPIHPVDFTRVELHDGFWKKWVETAGGTTIPYAFEKCIETGRIDNFIFAGGIRDGKFRGRFGFDDSDVYKIMEGASYSLMLEADHDLEEYLDTLITYLAAAQEEDGYLYTARTLKANDYNTFHCCTYSDEGKFIGTTTGSHEFYNAGHMYEAAVAHHLATGKRTFLDIALRHADLVYDVCITQGKALAPEHQEIEIGLVKLFRVTGSKSYLELARHLLEIRHEVIGHEYSQSHIPVTAQREAVGHAVRANYMYSAMTDIAALTGDSGYMSAVTALWENVVGMKLSVTGGVGARHRGEAYGGNYELPNHPYNETCAAIANVYWNHRMFLLTGEAQYMDVLERSLYNGVLPGLSLEGTTFFYPNTLQHDGVQGFNRGVNIRSPWFDCSCCPSNLSRFIPSVAGYAYALDGKEVFINLFINGRVTLEVPDGVLEMVLRTAYPWDGQVEIEFVNPAAVYADIHLRIPGWAKGQPVPSDLFTFGDDHESNIKLTINGERALPEPELKGYAVVKGNWQQGDRILLDLPIQVRKVIAHREVLEKVGLVALQYGPLVYCAEEADNQEDVLEAKVGINDNFAAVFDPELLGGVNRLEGTDLHLVPYYAWANRGAGKMNLWFDLDQ